MKIAVTSTDGEYIDIHFGKADTIFVFEIDKKGIKFLEKRNVQKYCSENPLHAFRAEEFNKVYNAVADCEILYTAKIGAVPAEKCRSLGLDVRQRTGDINSIINP